MLIVILKIRIWFSKPDLKKKVVDIEMWNFFKQWKGAFIFQMSFGLIMVFKTFGFWHKPDWCIISHYNGNPFFFKINLFIYLFLTALGLRCGARASHCGGLSCCAAQALGAQASVPVARGLQSAGSAAVAHGPSCSAACGILLDQGWNPCPLHWQADS